MKSRAISALVFGFCFGIIFAGISLFIPEINTVECGGKTIYSVYGTSINGDSRCVGGSFSETIGFPFASREKYNAPTINYEGLGMKNPSTNIEIKLAGLIGNLFFYWFIGFVFFFIFSRSRKSKASKKSSDS